MKKLMGILSVACLCGWLVGCAAEESTDAPVVTPTETATPGESMTADPGLTTEDPATTTEEPATTSEEPAIPGDTSSEEPATTTEDPAAP